LEHLAGLALGNLGEIAQPLEGGKELLQQVFGAKRHGTLVLHDVEAPLGQAVL
jgi:hypothetical protein